jgi:small redox-active disulfide protein 2
MKIDVYGPGCANCRRLEQQVKEVIAHVGIEAQISEVKDVVAIADAGVLRTPALAIDGNVVLQGRVPGVTELEHMIREAAEGSSGSPG